MSRKWHAFPYPDERYRYAGERLKTSWARLHRGDSEPWPTETAVADAWRAYHAGEFAEAVRIGLSAGDKGENAADKAAMIYATYLEDDAAAALAIFKAVAERCEQRQARTPGDANVWYYHAYALGRYGQGISVARALAQGLGGKIRASLERALELAPAHADAHIALGTWHAEIVDKVGAMVAGLSYGAKKEEAGHHFRRALELNPDSAIARMEFANAEAMLYGKRKLAEAERLYAEAAGCEAADAMERLDVEAAREELA